MISICRPSERNFVVGVDLTVSNFDRVTSWLRACLISCSVVVLALGVAWLSGFQSDQRQSRTEPIVPVESDSIREIALPNVVENVPVPEQESGSVGFPEATDDISLKDLLPCAIVAVSNILAESEEFSPDAKAFKKRQGKDTGIGGFDYPSKEVGIIPTHKRWRFEFSARDFDEYQRQLEAVGVVIGIAEKVDAKITKILMKTNGTEVLGSSREQESSTLRFGHRQQRLENWDRKIARSANVDTSTASVFHLIESKMHALLWELEKAEMEASHRQLHEIARTVFEIADVEGHFQFRVCEQRIR